MQYNKNIKLCFLLAKIGLLVLVCMWYLADFLANAKANWMLRQHQWSVAMLTLHQYYPDILVLLFLCDYDDDDVGTLTWDQFIPLCP